MVLNRFIINQWGLINFTQCGTTGLCSDLWVSLGFHLKWVWWRHPWSDAYFRRYSTKSGQKSGHPVKSRPKESHIEVQMTDPTTLVNVRSFMYLKFKVVEMPEAVHEDSSLYNSMETYFHVRTTPSLNGRNQVQPSGWRPGRPRDWLNGVQGPVYPWIEVLGLGPTARKLCRWPGTVA